MIVFDYKKEKEDFVFNEYILTKKHKSVSELILKEISNVLIDIKSSFFVRQKETIEKNWKEIENNFYKKLGDFYEVSISKPNLKCYLVRLDIFPYNYDKDSEEKWFCAPLFGSPADRNRVIMHELCHFFQPIELPKFIKEAIPVILNDSESFKMFSVERGHADKEEQEWRKIIWDLYKNGKRFSDLVKIIKNKNINI